MRRTGLHGTPIMCPILYLHMHISESGFRSFLSLERRPCLKV